jgi:hypothetical protein
MVSPSPGEATWSLERFASLANASEAELPLFKTALLISAIQYPNLPNGWWQEAEHRFEELLDETRHDWGGLAADSEAETLANYAAYFAGRLGFQGDRENYHQPDNSCLLKVMERRRGLPIALAVLFVEIGRRAGGLELFGVGAPGHFLAGGMAAGRAGRLVREPAEWPTAGWHLSVPATRHRAGHAPTHVEQPEGGLLPVGGCGATGPDADMDIGSSAGRRGGAAEQGAAPLEVGAPS